MRSTSAILLIAATVALAACQKKPSGPTTGDGIPVGVNASNTSVGDNQM